MALTKVSTPAIKDEAITLAKLLHGDSNNDGKFLRANNGADPSFESIPSPAITAIASASNNRLITSNGGTTVNAEPNLTFDGSQLDVIGTVRGNAFIGRSNISAPTADVSLYRAADNTLALATASTERMRIDASGRMLIGQTSSDDATSMLQVKRANNSTIRVASSDATATNFAAIDFAPANSIQGAAIICVADGTFSSSSAQSAHLRFLTRSSGTDAERMRIDASGRLLLGTTTEGYSGADQLTVAASNDGGITIRTGTGNGGILAFSDGTSGADEYRGYVQYQHQNELLAFGSNAVQRMSIVSNGEVGINLTNPEAYGLSGHGYGGLTVQSPSGGYSGITIRSNYAGAGILAFADGSGSNAERMNGFVSCDHVNKRLNIGLDGNTVARFTTHGFHPNPSDHTANTALQDYESGTWTVNTPQGNPTTFYSASYVKIGDSVTVSCYITGPSSSSGNNFQISSLPFQAKGGSNYAIGSCYTQVHTTNNVFVQVNPGNNDLYVYERVGNTVSFANLSGYYVLFTVTYFTD
tara:strand:- start:1275 stop:2858 length:1584 start_codon:yes stop_codon:yes gene_type:complete